MTFDFSGSKKLYNYELFNLYNLGGISEGEYVSLGVNES